MKQTVYEMDAGQIRALRLLLGLTQVEFGAILGVASLTVASWEQGKRYPRTRTYLKLLALGTWHAMQELEKGEAK